MIRECGQIATTDDKRTLTNLLGADKDMMRCDQTLGNDNMNAMLLNCTSGSHQNKDTRNCCIYVTCIMIITFTMFFAQIISCYFSICAISFVTCV